MSVLRRNFTSVSRTDAPLGKYARAAAGAVDGHLASPAVNGQGCPLDRGPIGTADGCVAPTRSNDAAEIVHATRRRRRLAQRQHGAQAT